MPFISFRFAALLCCLCPLTLAAQSQRYYVDAQANGSPDGLTWTTAFLDLHDALALALPGDEVWVAQGTYRPSATGDRHARYQLSSGVKLYGGFAGTEMLLAERQPGPYPTILSGDVGALGDSLDNTYTLLYLAYPDTATLVDGFTLRDAVANDPAALPDEPGQAGAALYVQGTDGTAYPTIRHCRFEYNTAQSLGGAVFVNGGGSGSVAPFFEDCQFFYNRAVQNGGALCRSGASWWDRPTDFLRCHFEGNRARWGACLYVTDAERSDTLDVRQCDFYRNAASFSADVFGLANLRQAGWSVVQFQRCTIAENKSAGLLMTNTFFDAGQVDLRLDSMLFHDNQVTTQISTTASAFYFVTLGQARCSVANSTFSGEPQPDFPSYYAADYQMIAEGYANDGNIYNLTLYNLNTYQCSASFNSLSIDIQKVKARQTYLAFISPPGRININNSTFYKTYLGVPRSYSKNIQNCVFVNNYFIGESVKDSVVNVNNVIIIDLKRNFGVLNRNAFLCNADLSNMHIRNSIFSDTFYCCQSYMGLLPVPYPGLPIGLDPLMVDTAQGDFRLLPCSPAWNAGDNASVLSAGLLTDLAGGPRIVDGQVDIGAYESPALALATSASTTGACFGQPTGTVTWQLENGCPPYDYLWAKGAQTDTTVTGLAAGDYRYTITDARGRTLMSTVQVPASAPQLTLMGDTLICPATSAGSLVAIVDGTVVPPVSYHWSNGAATQSIGGLGLGPYALTVTDAAGCSDVASANVLPSGIALSLLGQVSPATALNAANGSIQVTVQTGHGPYSAHWEPTGDTTFSINGLLPGTYTLTVTDSGGCTYTYDYVVEVVSATDAPDAPQVGQVLPNPARDQATLYFGDATAWRLFSASGEAVRQVKGGGPGGVLEVDLGDLPSGVYFYAFYTKNGYPAGWRRLVIVR